MGLAPMHQIKSVWGKNPEDVSVVTDRTECETRGVCFRVAVEEEKEICWHLWTH